MIIMTTTYSLKDWQQGYISQKQEFSYWIDEIEGEIPPELTGTLFRNGPGLLDINGENIKHPFDGDGMICSFTFKNGQVYFQNKFVQTEEFKAEQKAGKILYRGVFGTQKAGGWLANIFDLKLKNIANTNVIYWGGKLLALWEAAEPYQLNPATLETIGLDYLNGTLKKGDSWSAHPWLDSSCKMDNDQPCLVNFSVKPGPKTTITIYELNPEGKVIREHSHYVPGFAFLHDMVITPDYCIFFQNPVSFKPLPYILGFVGAGQCLHYNPQAFTQIILIPRNGKDQVKILKTTPCFVFHHANAFTEENKIIVDSVCYDSFPLVDPNTDFRDVKFNELPPGQLKRFTIDLETEKVTFQIIDERCCEFPSLHPDHVGRNYRFVYLGAAHFPTGNHPLQTVIKFDLKEGKNLIWSAFPRGFTGEPIFVPRPGGNTEDDGWVLILVYDAETNKSDLVILSAIDLQLVAKLHLKHHVPYGLHGNFTPECFV